MWSSRLDASVECTETNHGFTALVTLLVGVEIEGPQHRLTQSSQDGRGSCCDSTRHDVTTQVLKKRAHGIWVMYVL